MEIIKNIKEVSDVYFDNEWDTYDGYCIETDSRQLYFVIYYAKQENYTGRKKKQKDI